MTAEQITAYGTAALGLLTTFIGLISGAVYLWLKRKQNIRRTEALNEKAEEVNRHERSVNLQAEEQARVEAEQTARQKDQDIREREFAYITQYLKDALTTVQKELRESNKQNAAKIDKVLDDHRECRETLAEIRVRHETAKERTAKVESELRLTREEGDKLKRQVVQLETLCRHLERQVATSQPNEGGGL